jgi:hypothetical protein
MSAGGSSQVETSKDDELIRETAQRLFHKPGYVAGRMTTELGDAMRGALYQVKKEGRYWEDKYSVKKVENAYSPPAKKSEMTERSKGEDLAAAYAARDRQVAKWKLKAERDSAVAAAIEAEERARRIGTAAARAKAAAALRAAKTAKLNYSKAPK